ncbi:MAG: DUF4278 domain-containing protein [Cyanobacteria bacterium P01_D01_bin.44]
MKLTYRGVQYDYNPPAIETQSIETTGKYRGVDIRFRQVSKAPIHPLKVDLIYRGVPYTAGETVVAPQQPTEAAPALSVADQLRALFLGRERSTRQREQSMLIRLNEQIGITAEDAA